MGRPLLRRFCPQVEALEDRRLLAGNVISGYVFDDLNGNGLRDAGEPAIAGSTIELRNASGVLVGTAMSDAAGAYRFDTDATVSPDVQSLTRTVAFANQTTNSTRTQPLQQFDPALGILQSVEIRLDGKIVSDIKIENQDDESATVTGNVAGSVKLSGPGFTINTVTNSASSAVKLLAAYDGATDYSGTSGVSFGSSSASSTGSITLAGTQVAGFLGTGTVNLSLLAQAASNASGGGNLLANIASQGGGVVTVTYKYVLNRDLRPGKYTITQKVQPAGYLDGRESQGITVLANSIGTDKLFVTLGTADATDNNFGEYRPASLGGHVYHDANDNGLVDAGETLFANITITLTGTDDRGVKVTVTAKTDAAGSYLFKNLRPGTYTITQKNHPKGYGAGKLTAGSLGGTISGRQFGAVATPVGAAGVNYDFAEFLIKAPSGSGPLIGKGRLLGSTHGKPTPIPPAPPPVVVPPPPAGGGGLSLGFGKGRLLGSTLGKPPLPVPKPPSVVVPPPPGGGGLSMGIGKGRLLGSSAKK